MKTIFSESSPLMIAVKKLIDLAILNFLWILTSIPLITLGMTLSAFYDVVYKDIWHNRGMVIQDYFAGCKKNFKQAFPVGAAMLVLAVLMIMDIYFFRNIEASGVAVGYIWIPIALVLALLVVYFIWLTAGIARFSAPLKQIMKNSFALLLTHFPVSFLIAVLLVVCALGIWLIPSGLFILPVLCMLGCCLLIDRVFRLYMSEEERTLEDERNNSWRLHQKKRRDSDEGNKK